MSPLIKRILTSVKGLNNRINILEKKSSVTAVLSSTVEGFSLTTSDQNVPLDTTLYSKGTGLTLSNNTITIGPDISHILVSASFGGYLTATGSGYIRIGICKNGSRVKAARRDATLTRRIDMNLTDVLLEVTEGDEISFVVEASAAQSIGIENDVTYMTVTEI